LSDIAPTSTRPLRLELTASPGLAALIVAVHGAAAVCFLTILTGWQAVALSGLTAALGGIAAWDRALLRSPYSPRALEISRDYAAKCLFANGESAVLQPLRGTAVTRYWVALGLGSPRRRSLFVASGMLAPEPMRILRLWALWGKLPRVTSLKPAPASAQAR
jgi:hypothetical protein